MPVEQARWLIDLVYKPRFNDLPPDERQTRWIEVTVFFNNCQEVSQLLSEDLVKRLEARVRLFLRNVYKYGVARLLKVTYAYQNQIIKTGEWKLMSAMDRLNQVERLNFRLYETLAAVDGRLRICQKRGCNRLFVRTKRQLYCSPQHAQLERTKRFRSKLRVVDNFQRTALLL